MNHSKWFAKWQPMIVFSILLITVAIAGCTIQPIQQTNTDGNITLNFALKAGDEDVVCGNSYPNIGANPATIQIKDARFYLSNVQLINGNGESVQLELNEDGKWQNDGIALLDFEDGTADCSEIGNADLNNQIQGTVPAGLYTGISFDLGIPFELNHQDVVAASTPLNIPALWWNWQYGYKFARIDLKTDAPAPDNQFFIHLGSTGCGELMDVGANTEEGDEEETENTHGGGGMGAMPPSMPCNNPNVVSVTLTDFDPSQSIIVADLASLLESVNLKEPVPMPAGCMSGVDDPDCEFLMPNFGLSLEDGQCLNGCTEQRFFRIE